MHPYVYVVIFTGDGDDGDGDGDCSSAKALSYGSITAMPTAKLTITPTTMPSNKALSNQTKCCITTALAQITKVA